MKYYFKGTDKEIKFGDMIELDFTKDLEDSTKFYHMEVKFIPELLPLLIEEEVIEVDEEEDEDDLESRVTQLEETVAKLLAKKK